MGIQLMILAGFFCAVSNLCLRRSIDAGGTSRGYLMLQLSLSFLVMVLLNPVRTGNYAWNTPMAIVGLAGGVVLAGVMTFLGKALERGPPGLTIAILNCSSVMPILFSVLLFGSGFGFSYSLWNGVGSLFVILGIIWAGRDTGEFKTQRNWLFFSSAAFFAHVVYLVFLNWRALFINYPEAEGLGLSLSSSAASTEWFMPMIFLAAAFVQTVYFLSTERRMLKIGEVQYGFFGALSNGFGAFLMIKGISIATPLEQAMIFPLFSVTMILGCNFWGKWLYKEQVNWRANGLCIMGLIVGLVDWKILLG